jgi:ceramide glucosyltransferase
LHGDEPALEQNLETFFAQDYPAPFQIVLGVDSASDSAIPIVERLRARYPGVDVAVAVDGRRHGTNAKVSNLINMRGAARHDVFVLSDSDIAVTKDYLRRLAAELEPGDVGAVTCPYTGWAAGGLGSRFCAMGVSFHFLTNAITGVELGLAEPCFGSTIAVKRPVLDGVGGFEAVANILADDYEIGRLVRQEGHRLVVSSMVVRHACAERTVGGWLAHELRWTRTTRVVAPAGHAGSIITYPIPLALLGAILLGFSWVAVGILASTAAARAVLKWSVERHFGGDGGSLWLLPVGDTLSFAVFLVSLFGGSVEWRGARLQVKQDGALLQR